MNDKKPLQSLFSMIYYSLCEIAAEEYEARQQVL